MSAPERAALARALAELDDPLREASPRSRLRRHLLIAAALTSAVVLAGWIVVLAVTLPGDYRAGGWRVSWVGFDVILAVVFVATAWAAWQRRQVLIGLLVVLAVLLCCDAWFDTTLDWRTGGFPLSLLMAVAVELPLAVASLVVARRLMRLTMRRLEVLEGAAGPVPPVWRVPLFGEAATGYRDVFSRRGGQRGLSVGPGGPGGEDRLVPGPGGEDRPVTGPGGEDRPVTGPGGAGDAEGGPAAGPASRTGPATTSQT